MTWYIYVIRTVDDFLYTGIATDVARRFDEHRKGKARGSRYLRAHPPQALVFTQELGSRSLAAKVERQFKRLRRAQKEKLISLGRLDIDRESGLVHG